jgi:cytochrome c-type biogenesis protein CcsB
MAIWSSIFAFAVIATISKFSVLTEFVYRAGVFIPNEMGGKPFSSPFRYELPYVGYALAVSGMIIAAAAIAFAIYHFKDSEPAKRVGHILLKLGLVAQVISLALFITGIRTASDVGAKLKAQHDEDPIQYVTAGRAIAERQDLSVAEFSSITPFQFEQMARQYMQANSDKMYLSLSANPVEFAGLLTGLAATFFVMLFSFRTEKLRERLPGLESLDNLMYKTACLAFAGLAMLLITGAIWANESWGRPWGFDSKETGALVAWLTYAGFLHSRISRGWTGKSSAYFAIVGFLLVIFTYLGVSYLLPGLHSYA